MFDGGRLKPSGEICDPGDNTDFTCVSGAGTG